MDIKVHSPQLISLSLLPGILLAHSRRKLTPTPPKKTWLYNIMAANDLVKLDDVVTMDLMGFMGKRPVPLCLFCNNIMETRGHNAGITALKNNLQYVNPSLVELMFIEAGKGRLKLDFHSSRNQAAVAAAAITGVQTLSGQPSCSSSRNVSAAGGPAKCSCCMGSRERAQC